MLDLIRTPRKEIAISDHFDGKKFFNPHLQEKLPYFRLLKWLIKRKEAKWPKWVKNTTEYERPSDLNNSKVAITFINHASFLIQTPTSNILIDPIYSKRISPLSFIGPKRVRLPGIPFVELPPIDLVLISHNHYDHLDISTLKRIKKSHHNPLIVTGLRNKYLLNRNGLKNSVELDWWETYTYKDMSITFTPAQHFSSRNLFDRNKTLWGGFIISMHNKKIFFTGDSGYGPHFKEIYNRIGPINLAFLPIGAYKPRWFMKPMHMNPEEAVLTHLDLHAQTSIPMHYGTFPLSDEPFDLPLNNLLKSMKKHNVSQIKILDFGQTYTI